MLAVASVVAVDVEVGVVAAGGESWAAARDVVGVVVAAVVVVVVGVRVAVVMVAAGTGLVAGSSAATVHCDHQEDI